MQTAFTHKVPGCTVTWSHTAGMLPHLKNQDWRSVSVSIQDMKGLECPWRTENKEFGSAWKHYTETEFGASSGKNCVCTLRRHTCIQEARQMCQVLARLPCLLMSLWPHFTFLLEKVTLQLVTRTDIQQRVGLMCHLRLKNCSLKCSYSEVSSLSSHRTGKPRHLNWKRNIEAKQFSKKNRSSNRCC